MGNNKRNTKQVVVGPVIEFMHLRITQNRLFRSFIHFLVLIARPASTILTPTITPIQE